ncbi:lachesin [Trichonephila clavipes]|nr:lachesin [Trichonephila clavipes]
MNCQTKLRINPLTAVKSVAILEIRPKIRVPNQLVGAASGSDVVLECRLEASPSPLTSWIRSEGIMLLNNRKYDITEEKNGYKINMKIKIYGLTENDFGSYKCVAKNTLGEKEGFIRLYEIPPPTANPKVTQHYEVYLPRLRATRGPLTTDHVILKHGQVTWTTPELSPPSPNYHTTLTGGRFSSRQI